MNHYIYQLEKKRLREIAHEYRKKGYRVLVEPGVQDVPAFLSSFQIDMIAYGNDENVVVEVKSRATLPQSPELLALVDTIDAVPGWRLELAVTNPPVTTIIDGAAEDLNSTEIEARLVDADQALAATHEDSALLLAGSAAEAALRLFAEREDVELDSIDPKSIVRQLLILGVMERADYVLLREALKVRDFIVHGFRVAKPERKLVLALIAKTRELLAAANKPHDQTVQQQTFRAVN